MSEKSDYYLKSPPLQPKQEIADYIESQGILTPKRFNNFQEALESKKDFIVRSEHPQDYNGVSGVLESFNITQRILEKSSHYNSSNNQIIWKNVSSDFSIIPKLLSQLSLKQIGQKEFENCLTRISENNIKDYCQINGIERKIFEDQISYSYWERLGGYNMSMIADSAIEDKYHIFSEIRDDYYGSKNYNYSVIKNRKIMHDLVKPLSSELKNSVDELIEFYEFIRNLPRFHSLHCPIIELQRTQSKNIFLQYHRTRDFSPSTFKLERPLEDGEFQAEYVRGHTPQEGEIYDTKMYYKDMVQGTETGSFAIGSEVRSLMFEDIVAKNIDSYFMYESSFEWFAVKTSSHVSKSSIFKPKMSVLLNTIFASNELKQSWLQTKEGKDYRIPIRVVSDGEKAYVKILSQQSQFPAI